MSNFYKLKTYSEVAWAAYGGFFEAGRDSKVETTGKQRYHLNQKFEKLYEYDSKSGFQAKIFKDRTTGEYILSIRGTEAYPFSAMLETLKDVGADFNLFLNSTPGAQYKSLIEFINSEQVKQNVGNHKMIAIGHSLGGALAQLACKSFPDKFKECYTFNAPSVKNLFSKPVFKEKINNINKYFYYKEDSNNETYTKIYLDDNTGSALYNYQNEPMTSDVTNVRAKYGISLVANLWGKDRFGKLIEVAGDSHSIVDLTKVLYFYDEMIKHGVSETQVDEYIDKFYNTKYPIMSGSIVTKIVEKTMKDIDEIINGSSNKNDVIDIFLANDENKIDYKINLLNSNSSISKIFGDSNLTIPDLYSLVNLKPFIVSNISSPAYDEIIKYKDEYTAEYIKDKISMFKTAFGKLKSQEIHYCDYETGVSIYDTQDFNGFYDEYVFGTNSDNVVKDLNAKSGINKIYTLAGNDTIYGSKGKDIIYGGNGFDTYYVGDKDEIIDSDDNGRVFFNNLLLGESKQSIKNPNVYISKDDENIQYELKGSDLIITNIKTKESFTIKNYSKDKQSLGITLGDKSKVEMAFLSDTTGSMGGAINSVKSQIKELVNLAFKNDLNTRIGVFGYNDPYTETFTNLTNDKASIISAINSLYASGGGDYPELTFSGIIRAASANWSYGADKRLFLFGDAIAKDSHLKDDAFGLLKPNQQKERAIDILKKEGIKVYAIYTGNDEEAFNEFKELALATNGDYFKLDDDSLVADKIFDAMNYGTSSNDTIEGNDKDNSLNGFGGDDTLVGKAGSDTYTFTGLNFGNDTIIESNLNNIDKNTIIFKDVSYKDVRFKKDLNDLKITLNKDNSVTIKDFYNTNNESKISSISFSDVTLDELAIKRSVSMQANKEAIIFLKEKDFSFSNFATSTFAVAYQDNASNISTSYKDDVIIGSNKNDVISTKLGNDTLIGGKGDDKLYGGFGNDIYVYRKGDGNDLIYDDGGQDALKLQNLKADEIFLIKDGKDLLIKFKDDDTNSIRVAHHFAWKFGYHNQINTIELDDNKFINTKTIDKLIEQTSAFAKNNGIDIHNINHINDDRLNQIYMSAWN